MWYLEWTASYMKHGQCEFDSLIIRVLVQFNFLWKVLWLFILFTRQEERGPREAGESRYFSWENVSCCPSLTDKFGLLKNSGFRQLWFNYWLVSQCVSNDLCFIITPLTADYHSFIVETQQYTSWFKNVITKLLVICYCLKLVLCILKI